MAYMHVTATWEKHLAAACEELHRWHLEYLVLLTFTAVTLEVLPLKQLQSIIFQGLMNIAIGLQLLSMHAFSMFKSGW